MIAARMATSADKILVTGSNGFIGTRVVENLLARGFFNLRCFVRPASELAALRKILARFPAATGVEIMAGDLALAADCRRAAQSVSVVFHLAASLAKTFEAAQKNSLAATRQLAEALLDVGQPGRFVLVSSLSVYSNVAMPRGAVLDENSPLETEPEKRLDPYAYGKLGQEEILRELGSRRRLPFVILRPGTVFGPGSRELTGRLGRRASRLFVLVSGGNQLPLTFVDNCADAIVTAGLKPGVDGEAFNVVDDELMTSREFMRAYRSRVGGLIVVPVPYFAMHCVCAACDVARKFVKKVPRVLNRRRGAAEWRGNRFTNRKLRERTGWQPPVPMAQAMERFLAQFQP
jgi:nucleoside-diphosphate-sugar epimerase